MAYSREEACYFNLPLGGVLLEVGGGAYWRFQRTILSGCDSLGFDFGLIYFEVIMRHNDLYRPHNRAIAKLQKIIHIILAMEIIFCIIIENLYNIQGEAELRRNFKCE